MSCSDFSTAARPLARTLAPLQERSCTNPCAAGLVANQATISGHSSNGVTLALPQTLTTGGDVQTPTNNLFGAFNYNPSAGGNMALFGFSDFDGQDVTSFRSVRVQGTIVTTNPDFFVYLFAKNAANQCEHWRSSSPLSDNNDTSIVAAGALSGLPAGAFDVTLNNTAAVWQAFNYGPGGSPYHGLHIVGDLVSSPLTDFASTSSNNPLFRYPAVTALPTGYACGGVAVALGGPTVVSAESLVLKSVTLTFTSGSKTYTF